MKKNRLFLWTLALVALATVVKANLGQEVDDDEASVETAETVVKVETLQPEDNDVVYLTPEANPDVFFAEHFDGDEEAFEKKWIKSQAKKDDADAAIAKYDGVWSLEPAVKDALNGDSGLVLKSKAKHAAISAKLRKPFPFDDKPLIVQYELNFQEGQDCGGGYIKLLSHSKGLDLRQFNDKTPYTIMFGPDKCGSDAKLHFIFRHVNPKNKTIEEKHCKKLDTKERSAFEEVFKDKRPHLYKLVINPDNTFEMSIDNKLVNFGSLLEDFTPAVNPPAEIDDPADKKPEDWDEREKIPDPKAEKPEDWDEDEPRSIIDESAVMPSGWLEDEPETIPDPNSEKPDDWDEDMDGEWEPPQMDNPVCKEAPGCGKWNKPIIDNPKYKGKWNPPLINNPAYKGKWKPRKIPNPDYFHDPEPFKMTAISAVGIELWSMSSDLYFDNILITDKESIARAWAADTFDLKIQKLGVSDPGLISRIISYSNRNPWLYAVYLVVVGLPLVLIITFCCSGDGGAAKGAQQNGKSAHPKKSDPVQEDDEGGEEDEDEEDEEEEEEEEPQVRQRKSTRSRKARKD